MAIPFYYNPATNELELTADPSPLGVTRELY